jgi:hypothetical protein
MPIAVSQVIKKVKQKLGNTHGKMVSPYEPSPASKLMGVSIFTPRMVFPGRILIPMGLVTKSLSISH